MCDAGLTTKDFSRDFELTQIFESQNKIDRDLTELLCPLLSSDHKARSRLFKGSPFLILVFYSNQTCLILSHNLCFVHIVLFSEMNTVNNY